MKRFHPRRFYRMVRDCAHDWFFNYLLPDRWHIRYYFRKKVGYTCHLNAPRSFNEKIQWLNLHDRNPLYTKLTDKVLVKEFVSENLGSEYVIPTLAGGFSRFDDIPFDKLPNQFVLKCNHDSKSTIVCTDKNCFDYHSAKIKLEYALRKNYYHHVGKQWGYKNIKPVIFVEKYLGDEFGELWDYKFMMFNGQCKSIFLFVDRFSDKGMKMNCYDENWNLQPFTRGNPNTDFEIPKPKNLDEMLCVARRLAALVNNAFVRVDLYDMHGRIYFGEYTFYPGAGFDKFEPQEWDFILGDWIDIKK